MIAFPKKRLAALGAMLLVGALSGYALRSARADGIPDNAALTYAGTLEDDNGAPLAGSKTIQVRVYTNGTGAVVACESASAVQNVIAGHFEVTMPAQCVTAMKGNKDAHVEVVVDGKSLGRSRVGAVPFAVEAARASDATGALAARLAELERPRVSAFTFQTAVVTIPSGGTWTDVPGLEMSFAVPSEQDVDIETSVGLWGTAPAANSGVACRLRFVLDDTPLGPTGPYDSESEVALFNGSALPTGAGQLQAMRRQKLATGTHTLKAQLSTAPGEFVGGTCRPSHGRLRAISAL